MATSVSSKTVKKRLVKKTPESVTIEVKPRKRMSARKTKSELKDLTVQQIAGAKKLVSDKFNASLILFHGFIWSVVWYMLRSSNDHEPVIAALDKLKGIDYPNRRVNKSEVTYCVSGLANSEDICDELIILQDKFTEAYSYYRRNMLLKKYDTFISDIMSLSRLISLEAATIIGSTFKPGNRKNYKVVMSKEICEYLGIAYDIKEYSKYYEAISSFKINETYMSPLEYVVACRCINHEEYNAPLI